MAGKGASFGLARLLCAAALLAPVSGHADEGGIGLWIPGFMGSFAATPGQPGWSFSTVYYHTDVNAGGSKSFPRGGRVDAGLDGRGDLALLGASYVFDQPFLMGQVSFSLFGVVGTNLAGVDASLTGPRGNTISGSREDSVSGFGDVLPQLALKWNDGVHNYMTYVAGNLPVGRYDKDRLANLGLGHAALDWGLGYTYFNPESGREFSIVGGLTYNFENEHTDYQNGIDGHIDWAASQFLNPHFHVGVVGYAYQQLTGDSGSGATLGDFKSRVFGIGPQAGFKFNLSEEMDGYLNLKGYYEFEAKNRPEGWNVWLTLAFTPAAQKPHAQ